MTPPPEGEGEHHCTTCAPGAWVICARCEEEIKKKKRCPVCRTDYMHEPTSGWESLPTSTTTLELDAQPTQDELKRLSVRFPQLERLEISAEYEDDPDELDFAADGVRLPALKMLSLACVGLTSITFTEANTPALEHLSLSNITGQVCPFHLALPQLTSFFAEHTMLGERYMDTGQFGLSLSRCPRLETVDTYKFRCLGDCNYAVLPALQNLSLHRSECTTHLDILYAPKLTDVSLQAAYELRGFKLRNIPTATVATVEALLASKAEAAESARQAARAEDARWRDQSQQKALTKEARNRGWIERDEKWRVNPEPPAGIDDDADSDDMFFGGGGGGRSEYDVYEEILSEHCEEMFRKRVEPATKAAEAEHLGASVADASLPRCSIDVTNMSGFRLSSLEPQVRGRCRVRKESFDGFGGGFGSGFGGGCGSGGSDDEEDEGEEDDDDDDHGDEFGMGGDPRAQFMQMMQMMHAGRAPLPPFGGRTAGGSPPSRGGDLGGDPREAFMQMMMATGMPQMEGIRMIPGRVSGGASESRRGQAVPVEAEDEEEDGEDGGERERESGRKKGKRPKKREEARHETKTESKQDRRCRGSRHGGSAGTCTSASGGDANVQPRVEAAYGY